MGIRDRRKLSFAGHVVVNVVLDDKYELSGDPDLVSIGVAKVDATGEELEELMLDAAIGAVDSIPGAVEVTAPDALEAKQNIALQLRPDLLQLISEIDHGRRPQALY